MRRKRKGRPVNGILLLDKSSGITSNKALQQIKYLYQAQKAGHTGSLDPLASGMLPICLGEATKFSQYLLEADKQYHVVAKLGIRTNTGDAEGEIIATRIPDSYTRDAFEQRLNPFRGELQQIPSMFSALKHQGQPLYKLARQGIEIARQARTVHIYDLQLVNLVQDTVELIVHCSKGTYIRNLIDDLGEALGCGAHVTALRRLKVNNYPAERMVDYETLQQVQAESGLEVLDNHLLPMDSAIQHWPTVILSDSLEFYIKRGQAVQIPTAPSQGQVRLITATDQFIGIADILEDGRVAPKRLVVL